MLYFLFNFFNFRVNIINQWVIFMLKVKNKRTLMKKGTALVLASLLFASSPEVAHAVDNDTYVSSINDELKATSFSTSLKNILKAIVNTTNNHIALNDIDVALNDDEFSRYFIAQGICSFAQEQEKIKFKEAYELDQYNPYLHINYDMSDICIFNNLSRDLSSLPKQICLLTKLADFGSYSLYELHANTPCYVITDASGKILTYSTGDTYYDLNNKNRSVVPLKDFLKANGFGYEETYSYLDLFDGFTFDFSEKACNYTSSNTSKASDVLVIDGTGSITVDYNMNQDYYFIKYVCPNLFIEGEDIYKDIENPNAKITVDNQSTLCYYDALNDTNIYDIDMSYVCGGASTSALVPLKDFAKGKNLKVGFTVTDYELKEFSDSLNIKDKSLGKTH